MALLSRIRDLISRNLPQYAPTDPRTVPILGPDGEDFSIEEEDPEGPLRQIGERRVLKPMATKLRAGLPDIISSGINAAAHVNTTGGGATDFFGALQDAEVAGDRRRNLEITRRRQAQLDAEAENLKRAQADYYRARPGIAAGELDVKSRNADTAAGRLTESERNNKANTTVRAQGNVIRGKGIGYDVPDVTQEGGLGIIPPLAGHPAAGIRPMSKESLSEQQRATLERTGADTENVQARTEQVGVEKPVTQIVADDKGNLTGFSVKPGDISKAGGRLDLGPGGKSKAIPMGAQGSFTPLTDDKGNVTSFFNPKTGQNRPAPDGSRTRALPPAEQTRRAMLEIQMEDAATLGALGEKYQKHIGFVKGRLSDVERKTLGVDEGINDMFRIADNLADILLRARSGAAINEDEYTRLRALMPDPRSPYAKFKSDLRLYQSEIKRLYEKSTGKPAPGHPAASASSGAVEEWTRDASGKLVKK